jgi:hypothetical protein
MSRSVFLVAAALLALGTSAQAATFRIENSFSGHPNLSDPGRQVLGGEPFISFDIANDVFQLNGFQTFGVSESLIFANDDAGNLPTGGANVIVLRSFDNDNDPLTAFGAGNAADLIAAQVTDPGAGFFIYFNSGLDLPRLVFSTDLSDSAADLQILARMTNLTGQTGRDAMANFSAANFNITNVPEPSSFLLMSGAGALWACGFLYRRRRARS